MIKRILSILFVLAVLVGGYVIYTSDSTPEDVEVSGVVSSVDLEQVMVDGPALIEIKDADEKIHTIAVPSMGIMLCPAFESIADSYAVVVGDRVSVRGLMDENERVVPCEKEEHFLKVTKEYVNTDLGFSFDYDGSYVFEDNMVGFSEHEDFVYGSMLTDAKEYEEFHSATDAREGPPTIQVRVLKNTDNVSALEWAEGNPLESNIEMALAEPEATFVGGKDAVHYVADGLFAISTYIVTSGEYVFLVLGMSLDADSSIAHDFKDIVSSFSFSE